jgi:hypothetical protein
MAKQNAKPAAPTKTVVAGTASADAGAATPDQPQGGDNVTLSDDAIAAKALAQDQEEEHQEEESQEHHASEEEQEQNQEVKDKIADGNVTKTTAAATPAKASATVAAKAPKEAEVAAARMVSITCTKSHSANIGGIQYDIVKGNVYTVPEDVAMILANAFYCVMSASRR